VVHFVGAGTCTIRAHIALGVDFAAATGTTQSFVVAAATQFLTFTQPNDLVYGGTGETLTANASSGLSVDLAVSGPCLVQNMILTATGAGTCTVTASQPGSSDYQPAANVTRTVLVQARSITFSISDLSQPYSGKAITVGISAAPVMPASFTVTYNGSLTAPIQPGRYQVVVTSTDPNNIGSASAVLEIEVAPIVLPTPMTGTGPALDPNGTVVLPIPSGTSPGNTVVLLGEELLGSFAVPSTGNIANLLSTSAYCVQYTNLGTTSGALTQLGTTGSLVWPTGNFPGAGTYGQVEISDSCLQPGYPVSLVLHSTPINIASSVTNSSGSASLVAAIPASFAGASHSLYLEGALATASVTKNANGQTVVIISRTVFNRFAPGTEIAIGGSGGASVGFSVPATLAKLKTTKPTSTTTKSPHSSSAGSGTPGSISNPPTYSPLSQPAHSASVVNSLGAVVAAAAGAAGAAGVAASSAASAGGVGAGAGGSGGGGGSSGSGGGSGGGRDQNEDSRREAADREKIWIRHRKVDPNHAGRGDNFFTWRLPGLALAQWIGTKLPSRLGRTTAFVSAASMDAAYLRVLFGSLWLLLLPLGAVLGVLSANATAGVALPPGVTLFGAVMILGLFDALSGLVAFIFFALVVSCCGHLNSVHALLGLAGVAALWASLSLLLGKLRPLRRDLPKSFDQWWLRLGDYVIAPLGAWYLTVKLISVLPALTGRTVAVASDAKLLGLLAGIAILARLLLEDASIAWMPERTRLSRVEPKQPDSWARRISLVIRLAFFTLFVWTFIGTCWQLWGIAALLYVTELSPLIAQRMPRANLAHRFIPKSLPKIGVVVLISGVISTALASRISGATYLADDILCLALFTTALKIATGIKGETWPRTWFSRFGGASLAVLTALVCIHVITF
jgi:hypothetical protein